LPQLNALRQRRIYEGQLASSLEIQIAETRRFELDCALYQFGGAAKERALDILGNDPAIGRPHVENAALWQWSFGEFDLIYAISGDFSKLVLLELRPQSVRQRQPLEQVFAVIDRINAIKRLFGL
tara:strand:+ start:1352 stop:1726 length:375 start_codon:yes stop_codon:yes gene_type:complete